jgi:hypothetical protein
VTAGRSPHSLAPHADCRNEAAGVPPRSRRGDRGGVAFACAAVREAAGWGSVSGRPGGVGASHAAVSRRRVFRRRRRQSRHRDRLAGRCRRPGPAAGARDGARRDGRSRHPRREPGGRARGAQRHCHHPDRRARPRIGPDRERLGGEHRPAGRQHHRPVPRPPRHQREMPAAAAGGGTGAKGRDSCGTRRPARCRSRP